MLLMCTHIIQSAGVYSIMHHAAWHCWREYNINLLARLSPQLISLPCVKANGRKIATKVEVIVNFCSRNHTESEKLNPDTPLVRALHITLTIMISQKNHCSVCEKRYYFKSLYAEIKDYSHCIDWNYSSMYSTYIDVSSEITPSAVCHAIV